MAQKTKVKELVGRGLDSYHTKSLQQIDRIEKKNKEQNHKISILSNELDNDYLTKTEEGSVISLEHSKEGMVYLDELQGNTLVNYCTDGSKELTLNGDIDVEGTFVTTTEGVDNGLVDVACEGNTLVNLFSGKITDLYGGNYRQEEDGYITLVQKSYGDCIHLKTDMYKPSTTYTLIVDVKENTLPVTSNLQVDGRTYMKSSSGIIPAKTKGLYKMVFTTIDDFSTTTDNKRWGFYFQFAQANQETKGDITLRFILLEGDWTNKEIPSYFTEMKSVGQDDENGHKIEILSQNKNLFNGSLTNFEVADTGGQNSASHAGCTDYIEIKPNTPYTLSSPIAEYNTLAGLVVAFYDSNKKFIKHINMTQDKTSPSNARYCRVRTRNSNSSSISKEELSSITLQLEEGTVATSYVKGSMNKKEILMNEPLRGLSNSIKDRFVKISNKWFIEKNCEIDNVDSNKNWQLSGNNNSDYCVAFAKGLNVINLASSNIISDTLPTLNSFSEAGKRKGIYLNANSNFVISVPSSECNSLSGVEGVKYWLQNNPTTVVYPRDTIIYEPLEVEPTLNTYNDVTHISNNSIIPCNMKIQNTGYNAIIKPSTLYTIALDTNKSGTIGMNLGGAKGTTTNNVATITTPATLTDDSLRLYGKGIKGSKVRLLEGDKTNWIPSHFESMQSSFEDKLQDDGTYKMEILSKNKNLFNVNDLVTHSQNLVYFEIINDNSFKIKSWANRLYKDVSKILKPNTKYTIKCKATVVEKNNDANLFEYNVGFNLYNFTIQRSAGAIIDRSFTTLNYSKEINWTFTTPSNLNDFSLLFYTNRYVEDGVAKLDTILVENLIITEHNSEYEQGLLNKIQFSSIEPLRKWDRFVFKDNKLMIERNSRSAILNGSEDWRNEGTRFWVSKNDIKLNGEVFSNKYPSGTYSELYYGKINLIALHNTHKQINVRDINVNNIEKFKEKLINNPITVVYQLAESTYEEIPFELQKIILEGYENGTLFFDTNIPPTSTVTYAGETPIVKSVKLNKTEVSNNTDDINDNIIPYLMDMDYRVVCLQLATEEIEGGVSMAKLFGGAYEMLKRDILSKRLTREEYGYRLADYFNAGKLTEEQVRELEDLR